MRSRQAHRPVPREMSAAGGLLEFVDELVDCLGPDRLAAEDGSEDNRREIIETT